MDRDSGYEMASFHIHHKYEVYYEIEGSRRYFIEDAAYIVNAGCVVLIGENQIHKTASLGDTASSRIVMNFSREYLDKIMDIFPEVDFFSFLSEEHNHLLSNITVKQQNHIHGLLQQLLALQEETSPESDALRKMLLATLCWSSRTSAAGSRSRAARMAASATTLWIRSRPISPSTTPRS
ncbi:AraC family ligand binding domain-containing protein [Gemmiger formicilis]|nr:AraC family ligand binding domain-containing protein [Gemmiger formicilis]